MGITLQLPSNPSVDISVADVKSYLIIGSTTYDVNIGTVLTIWETAIDDMIEPAHLADTSLSHIIKAGKLLFICSKVRENLPADAFGKSEERVEYTTGNLKTVIDNRQRKTNEPSKTWFDILKPYLKEEILNGNFFSIESSTEGYEAEFSLTRCDENSGSIISEGSMDHWN